MKYLVILILSFSFTFLQAQPEKLEVEGAINVKKAEGSSVGTIEYNSSIDDFRGNTNGGWKSFTSGINASNTITDIDGNVYPTVRIGNQVWMSENLRVTRYNDGTPIPHIAWDTDWLNDMQGAWSWYDNDPRYNEVIGKHYNWYALDNEDICPAGWHLPTEAEFQTLVDFVATFPNEAAYVNLSSMGYPIDLDTNSPWPGNNRSGFTARPAGQRDGIQGHWGLTKGIIAVFWTFTNNGPPINFSMSPSLNLLASGVASPNAGASVRCLKN